MKKNKIISIVALIMLLTSSCNDNFEPQIFGVLNPENYPSNEKECEALAMTCYVPFGMTWQYNILSTNHNQAGWYLPEGGVLKMFEYTTDAVAPWTMGWGGSYLQFSSADFSQAVYFDESRRPDAENLDHFPKMREITRFTYIIGQLEKVSDEILSNEKRQQLLGETRLLRGLMMYYAFHIYGPVPVILNPDDVINEEVLSNTVRPSLQQMAEWITADFEYAAANAAEVVSEKGRYTRDYARVCLMRHCLNEGYHMSGYYQRALDMYEEMKGKYSLFTQGANPYAECFKIANKFNSEIIMAVSCDESGTGEPKSGNMYPLMMLAVPVDAARTDDQGNPTPFYLQGQGWGQTYNVAPKFWQTYDANDKRRETILTSYFSTSGQWVTDAHLGSRWAGYIINKFPVETDAPYQGTDVPLARWADVLLMYAEADVRKSNSTPSADAIAAVNEVRHRAGLGDLPATATASKDAFLDALLTERGHELLFEGIRKIDLIRFNQYAQRTYQCKGVKPTHQYMPLPNYVVDRAKEYGKDVAQTYERDGWQADLAAAR